MGWAGYDAVQTIAISKDFRSSTEIGGLAGASWTAQQHRTTTHIKTSQKRFGLFVGILGFHICLLVCLVDITCRNDPSAINYRILRNVMLEMCDGVDDREIGRLLIKE